MSFEVYLQCFRGGRPAGLPIATVRALFPVVSEDSEPEYWRIRYDDLNDCRVLVSRLDLDSALVHALSVERPCQDLRLWDALLTVMKMGPVVLYFPGSAAPLVADEAVAGDLPVDMFEALGPPRVVRSGEEIKEIIRVS